MNDILLGVVLGLLVCCVFFVGIYVGWIAAMRRVELQLEEFTQPLSDSSSSTEV
jgi:type III secretory pathway component EscT